MLRRVDKMDKTIPVELEQRSTHPLYGKVVRSTRTVKVHDEHNEAHIWRPREYYGDSAPEQDQALASRYHHRAR